MKLIINGISVAKTVLPRFCGLVVLSTISMSPASAQFLKKGPSVFNYNFGDAFYTNSDGSDGFGPAFSIDMNDNYALQIAYTRVSDGPFDAETISAGVSYHFEFNRLEGMADWVFSAGVDIIDVEDIDEMGLFFDAGIRYAVNDPLELNTSLNYSTAFDADVSLNVKALYEVFAGFSAFAQADIGSGSGVGVGLRYYWR